MREGGGGGGGLSLEGIVFTTARTAKERRSCREMCERIRPAPRVLLRGNNSNLSGERAAHVKPSGFIVAERPAWSPQHDGRSEFRQHPRFVSFLLLLHFILISRDRKRRKGRRRRKSSKEAKKKRWIATLQ